MRRTADRIRYAVSFEIIGLLLVVPLGAIAFHHPVDEIGVVAIVGATAATAWNYVYNLIFDRAMQHRLGHTAKTPALRVLHAVLFEAGLLALLLPFIAWWLGIGLVEALVMDLGFAAFYLVYAFVFGWIYDLVFPIPAARQA
ncbi:PACE efflux transporter [Wenxinia marina]|uniref:Putative membrane protein n=1 Tax=Wenxinia marina DSM 24838 TaxID=1123501 RepID=A0A0D0QFZ3_9RHOB|nr:PACE efflux transporter [Wenxinia marina]KIQ71167.1 putative membrane protein [Wenxinia marina DSM 24838]GGL54311.1 membrane protein [Wenxinia marina]